MDVEVLPKSRESDRKSLPPSCPALDSSSAQHIAVTEIFPNPAGDDAGNEWIEIHNSGPFLQRLCGIAVEAGAAQRMLDDVVLDAGERRTIPIVLPNSGGDLRLLLRSADGDDHQIQSVSYPEAKAGWSWTEERWNPVPTPGDRPKSVSQGILENSPVDIALVNEDGVHLRAATPSSISLEGWSLDIAGSTIPLDAFSISRGRDLLLPLGSAGFEDGKAVRLLDPGQRIADVFSDIVPVGERLLGRVDGVIDGDTISVRMNNAGRRVASARVRMIGMDAPEWTEEGFDGAGNVLEEKLLGRDVVLEVGETETDVYGRMLATVFYKGMDVQAWMIGSGFAHVSDFSFPRRDEYLAIEEHARMLGVGLWKLWEEE